MARYYNAETLLEFVKQNTPHIDGETTMKCVERAIKEAPTADVVEVVRCRNCEKRIGESITGETFCLIHEVSVPYDYYCASGERRKTDER